MPFVEKTLASYLLQSEAFSLKPPVLLSKQNQKTVLPVVLGLIVMHIGIFIHLARSWRAAVCLRTSCSHHLLTLDRCLLRVDAELTIIWAVYKHPCTSFTSLSNLALDVGKYAPFWMGASIDLFSMICVLE